MFSVVVVCLFLCLDLSCHFFQIPENIRNTDLSSPRQIWFPFSTFFPLSLSRVIHTENTYTFGRLTSAGFFSSSTWILKLKAFRFHTIKVVSMNYKHELLQPDSSDFDVLSFDWWPHKARCSAVYLSSTPSGNWSPLYTLLLIMHHLCLIPCLQVPNSGFVQQKQTTIYGEESN